MGIHLEIFMPISDDHIVALVDSALHHAKSLPNGPSDEFSTMSAGE
jgi:hypothetical protein